MKPSSLRLALLFGCSLVLPAVYAAESYYYWQQLEMEDAQDISTGSSAARIAILSTGIDYRIQSVREGIARNAAETGYGREDDNVDNDRNGYVDDVYGVNVVRGNGDPLETDPSFSGGTNAASIIRLFAPRTKYIPIKAFDRSEEKNANSRALSSGLEYAVLRKARILIWGVSTNSADSEDVCQAISAAGRYGLLVITSAGAMGTELDSNNFPGGCAAKNLVTVATSNSTSALAPFSSYSPRWVHIAAPGVNIPALNSGGKKTYVNGGIAAASITAAVASLILSTDFSLKPQQLKERLLVGADVIPELKDKVLISGRVNAYQSLVSSYGD